MQVGSVSSSSSMVAQGEGSERRLMVSTGLGVDGFPSPTPNPHPDPSPNPNSHPHATSIRRVQGRQDPPLQYFNTHLGDMDTPRQLVEYARATAAAETVHIVSEDENYRLLGAQGFIFFPSADWQVLLAGTCNPDDCSRAAVMNFMRGAAPNVGAGSCCSICLRAAAAKTAEFRIPTCIGCVWERAAACRVLLSGPA